MIEGRGAPLVAVILAGGGGTRLWPLARAGRPKQFLALSGRGTLFQQACRRGAAVASRRRVLVVCGDEHRAWVRRQAPWIPTRRVITEGEGRNTAASIALAAQWIVRQAGDATMVVIPSDHRIEPLGAFRRDVAAAARLAQRPGALVTLGVPARTADTGFGYIRTRGTLAPGRSARVTGFVEKPPRRRAQRLLARGGALWNSGMFVWRASHFLDALEALAPPLSRAVRRGLPHRGAATWRIPRRRMRRIPALPVDKAVLERADEVFVVRATFEWSDLGTFDALASVLGHDARGNRATGRLVDLGAQRCVSVNPGGVTLLVAVRDLIVVRDADVVLVCPRGASQGVRAVRRHLVGRLAAYA